METIFYAECRMPWVSLLLASSKRGLASVHFIKSGEKQSALRWLRKRFSDTRLVRSPEANRQALRELKAYAKDGRQEFSVPLDLQGSPFQIRVWKEMRKIPPGQTRSYADIARAVGRTRAFRAVGMAARTNPLCIVTPCHRVIGSDGRLGGFGGGLKLKRQLLEHEQE